MCECGTLATICAILSVTTQMIDIDDLKRTIDSFGGGGCSESVEYCEKGI